MKALGMVLGLAMLWQAADQADAPRPQPKDFRYVRMVQFRPEPGAGKAVARACATVPGELYERSPTLADVRLYSEGQEVPYALTSSESVAQGNDAATLMNAGVRAGHVVFDLQMPARAYSSVTLDLTGEDFTATATVTGLKDANDHPGTQLGTFTVFDLTGQRLGSSTTLPLAETTFPVLHVDLAVSGVAGKPAPTVTASGAEVPPSREAQTLYTVVAATSVVTQRGRDSVATFRLPAHVPVERVSFEVVAGDRTNFSRPVRVRAQALPQPPKPQPGRDLGEEPPVVRPAEIEEIPGEISRVRLTEGAREIRSEALSVPATIGANGDGPATVEVAVENGDDVPLKLAAVRLEMRERQLCFDGPGPASDTRLYYGHAGFPAPIYDYARLFTPGGAAREATLGAEEGNALFTLPVVPVEKKSLTERHPELLWGALLLMVGALGVVAFRSVKKI